MKNQSKIGTVLDGAPPLGWPASAIQNCIAIRFPPQPPSFLRVSATATQLSPRCWTVFVDHMKCTELYLPPELGVWPSCGCARRAVSRR